MSELRDVAWRRTSESLDLYSIVPTLRAPRSVGQPKFGWASPPLFLGRSQRPTPDSRWDWNPFVPPEERLRSGWQTNGM